MPSRAMPNPSAATLWARAWRSDRRPDHCVLCCAGTYTSGRLRPRALAKATQTLSTEGDWEGMPQSLPRVAEVQSAPTYWTAAEATPSVSATRQPKGWRPASGSPRRRSRGPWPCLPPVHPSPGHAPPVGSRPWCGEGAPGPGYPGPSSGRGGGGHGRSRGRAHYASPWP